MNYKQYIFLSIFIALAVFSYAAPPPPPSSGPGCWPPPCVPIDGGITLLMAAGAAYGAKKIFDSKKRKASDQ